MSRHTRKLGLEQIEDRQLMSAAPWSANQVEFEDTSVPQAVVDGGLLSVQGTDADEQITIEQLRRGRVRVQVVDQATDGATLQRTFRSRHIDSVEINAGGGNDRLIQATRLPATISGGAGDDSLYSRSVSELTGDEGTDRFLVAHTRRGVTSTVVDQDPDTEVQIHLHDGARESVELASGRTGAWGRGRFAADEVAVLDQVFSKLQERTGNQRLLQSAFGEELHSHRHGRPTAGDRGIGGWNVGTDIHLTEMTFASDTQAKQIVLHEIGHNWDDPSEQELVSEFRALSGWQEVNGVTGEGQYFISESQWVYDVGASFAREYGSVNPYEDFATHDCDAQAWQDVVAMVSGSWCYSTAFSA